MAGPGFELRAEGSLRYLVPAALASRGAVVAAFSTRHGGVSRGPFAALNVGLGAGDEEDSVRENRRRLLGALGLEGANLVSARQVHGSRVLVVGSSGTAREGTGGQRHGDRPGTDGIAEGPGAPREGDTVTAGGRHPPQADGLVTSAPGVALAMYFADCVPLFLFSPDEMVVALAHAGWRGTALGVGVATLRTMTDAFGCRPHRVLVAVGPSIGPCCYHVGEDVKEAFRRSYPFPERFFVSAGTGRWHLDLWRANACALLEAGVQPENVFQAQLCTCCRQDLFYSYRRDRGRTGRMAAVMALYPGGRKQVPNP